MSCPQSESAANHRSSAPPIKNRQFFVKVFYLSVFCKVVFGEIKSNRRILRFFQAFHHPVLFRALVRRFFLPPSGLIPFPRLFAFQMLRTRSSEHIFGLPSRFPVLRRHLRSGYSPSTPSCALQARSDHSRASCAQSPKQPAFPAAPPCARQFPPPFSRTAHRRIPCGHSRFGTSAPEPCSYGESSI